MLRQSLESINHEISIIPSFSKNSWLKECGEIATANFLYQASVASHTCTGGKAVQRKNQPYRIRST